MKITIVDKNEFNSCDTNYQHKGKLYVLHFFYQLEKVYLCEDCLISLYNQIGTMLKDVTYE